MFRKTTKEQQLGLFSVTDDLLNGKSKIFYQKDDSRHNLFRSQVTMRIDESPYSNLYSEKMEASNVSFRVLIATMILKEVYGWSNAQLFGECRYNLLLRSPLVFCNINDEVSTKSTYYLLRKRVVEYENAHSVNLIEKTFADITKQQAVEFEISDKSTCRPAESKLLKRNIAWYRRYEQVHEILRLFYKSIKSPEEFLDKILITALNDVLKEEGNKVVYRNNRKELKIKLVQLGVLIDQLLQVSDLPQTKHYQTLCCVFSEQFQIDENHQIINRSKEEIIFFHQTRQDAKSRNELEFNTQDELIVTDTLTAEIIPANLSKDETKWRIKTQSRYRYFTQKQIDACQLRKQIKNIPTEILQVRNNVEASIFQLGYHYPHDKSRYRGLIKHKMWAFLPCLWVNFIRIRKYIKQLYQRTKNNAKSALESFVFKMNFLFQTVILQLSNLY